MSKQRPAGEQRAEHLAGSEHGRDQERDARSLEDHRALGVAERMVHRRAVRAHETARLAGRARRELEQRVASRRDRELDRPVALACVGLERALPQRQARPARGAEQQAGARRREHVRLGRVGCARVERNGEPPRLEHAEQPDDEPGAVDAQKRDRSLGGVLGENAARDLVRAALEFGVSQNAVAADERRRVGRPLDARGEGRRNRALARVRHRVGANAPAGDLAKGTGVLRRLCDPHTGLVSLFRRPRAVLGRAGGCDRGRLR